MKKVYVAGSSKEMPRVKRVMEMLRGAGYEITFDWVAEIERVGNANPADLSQRKKSALSDVEGVLDADVILALHPGPGIVTAGLWFELGVQYGYLACRADNEEFDDDLQRPPHTRSEFLAASPVFISYEKEAFTGPCIFDSLFETKPILDADILFTLTQFTMHQPPEKT